ncbi:MAG: oligosaccharide repeat unit polymerase [Deltaproteobacteria bacterium]|nr:oligosaccharide repeat unit polymerase [Deltaproteobacteria bacterium]
MKVKIRIDIFSPALFFPFMFILVFYGGYFFTQCYLQFLGEKISFGQWYYYSLSLSSYLIGVFTYAFYIKIKSGRFRLGSIVSDSRFWIFIWSIFIIAFLSLTYRLYKVGIPFLSYEPECGRMTTNLAISGYVSVLSLSLEVVLVFCLIYRWILHKKGTVAQIAINLLIGLSFIGLLLTASRNRIFIPVAIFLVCYHYLVKRFSMKRLAIYGIVLLSIFTAYGWARSLSIPDRFSGWGDVFGVSPRMSSLTVPLILPIMNPSLMFYHITSAIPEGVPYQYGSFLLSGIVAVLPGYQPSQGVMIKDILNISSPNPIAISMLGTFWVDFGLIGLIIGMWSVGFILRFLYLKMVSSGYRLSFTILYAYFLVYFTLTLYSGFLEGFTDIWFPFLFFIGAKFIEQKPRQNVLYSG